MFKYLMFGPLIFLVFATDVKTRPISYPNGWTIMQMNDVNKNSVHIHLTPSVKYSDFANKMFGKINIKTI